MSGENITGWGRDNRSQDDTALFLHKGKKAIKWTGYI